MSTDMLLPQIDEDSAPFWEGTRRGELLIQQCPDTTKLIFPPRPFSPWGSHREPRWIKLSGRGSIWSFVVPHPPLLPQFAEVAPYNVIAVALAEDATIRLVGNLVTAPGDALDRVDPGSIEIGSDVRVVFDPVTDEIHMPRWVLV